MKMGSNCILNLSQMSEDSRKATKQIVDVLFSEIYPLINRIRNKLKLDIEDLSHYNVGKIQDIFMLCCSQIKKCILNLLDIFKLEHHQALLLQDSRQCTLERLSWCVNRLTLIEEKLNKYSEGATSCEELDSENSILATPIYFVNWIDHTFEILTKLSDLVYETDYKNSDELYEQWKYDVVECATDLHISIDELLLSAMTLCKYCLPSDQYIVKARSQVVLREAKALLSELIEADLDTFKATTDTLKLPIKPSNVNILIDILKDVLYVLETNTNTALLALLIHCFSYSVSPVDVIRDHFRTKGNKRICVCHVESDKELSHDCSFVKEFDLYNERLLQIGSFAVSCSSDQNRILSLRSGLATLEALDSHLVPALMMSPDGPHSLLLTDSWRNEVLEIRDCVFLIVDPAAFAEKSKQIIHQRLLEVLKGDRYDNESVCYIINIGCVIHDFFSVYNKYELDALSQHEKLLPLLADLNTVQIECKVVSNILSSGDDFVYDVKKGKDKVATMEQLYKRLKLLFTLISKINSLLHPKENEEQLFENDVEDAPGVDNLTRTIHINGKTYNNSPRKRKNNLSRSVFARTFNLINKSIPLSKLTKHLKAKKSEELSFSFQLDQLMKKNSICEPIGIIDERLVRDTSILYNFSLRKNRASLRKAVLEQHIRKDEFSNVQRDFGGSVVGMESLMDEETNLQITDILDQMSNMTYTSPATKQSLTTNNIISVNQDRVGRSIENKNVLRLNINHGNATTSKHVWNIPVNCTNVEVPLDDTASASNVTHSSYVTTLERIQDLDLVESKLSTLKSLQKETRL